MYPEQVVAVAGGVVAGLLLLVLLGIAAYLFWKSNYLKGSYEELTDPVTPVLQEPDVAQSTSVPPQNARYKGPFLLSIIYPSRDRAVEALSAPSNSLGSPSFARDGESSQVLSGSPQRARIWGRTINPGTPRPPLNTGLETRSPSNSVLLYQVAKEMHRNNAGI